MEIVANDYIQDIHNYFQDFTVEDIEILYKKAYDEVIGRVNQLAKFEHIDQDSIFKDARIVNEIRNSIRNLTLSYIQFEQDHNQYAKKYHNIFEFVENEALTEVFFEQSVTEGHPFHPMTKTKLGLDINEVIKYSPEFRNSVKVIPVLCDATIVNEVHTTQTNELDKFKQRVHEYCQTHQIQLKDYSLLFIHEWQLEYFMRPQFEDLFTNQFMISLYDLAIESSPLLSFRTLDVAELDYIVKTAVNVQATSAVRNVSPASIHNGIVLSEAVERIYRANGYHKSYIQRDLSGAYLNVNQEHANKCSYMLRERIPHDTNSHHLVCGSLITKSFITKKHILIECIETIMNAQNVSFQSAAELFLTEYAHILLEATYRLILEEGISLEAHMQNSTVVIKDGMPISIYVRDFGGVRLFDRDIDIHSSTGLITDSFEDLLSVFSHSVLYNHLFQLIQVLESYGYKSEEGYTIIRSIIAEHHEHCAPEINILEQPAFNIKSLLKMRIFSEGYDYQYTKINNPLFMEDK